MKIQRVGGTPIYKLKEKFIPAEVFLYSDFEKLSKKKDLNPSGLVYKDEEKMYFYNSVTCHYYFYLGGSVGK